MAASRNITRLFYKSSLIDFRMTECSGNFSARGGPFLTPLHTVTAFSPCDPDTVRETSKDLERGLVGLMETAQSGWAALIESINSVALRLYTDHDRLQRDLSLDNVYQCSMVTVKGALMATGGGLLTSRPLTLFRAIYIYRGVVDMLLSELRRYNQEETFKFNTVSASFLKDHLTVTWAAFH